jgi:hypothetical protein
MSYLSKYYRYLKKCNCSEVLEYEATATNAIYKHNFSQCTVKNVQK